MLSDTPKTTNVHNNSQDRTEPLRPELKFNLDLNEGFTSLN